MRALRTAVPCLTLLTALAACSTPGTDTTAGPADIVKSAGTPTTTTPATSDPAPGTGRTTSPVPGKTTPATSRTTPAESTTKAANGSGTTPVCRTKDVGVSITLQPGGSTRAQRGLVLITNTSNRTCTVDGWLSITLVNAADEPLDVPTKTVNEPGAPESAKLRPGTSAFAGIKWTPCNKDDADCWAGNTIRYSLTRTTNGPAAELEDFPAPERSDITMASLRIGSIQPIIQGVVAW